MNPGKGMMLEGLREAMEGKCTVCLSQQIKDGDNVHHACGRPTYVMASLVPPY